MLQGETEALEDEIKIDLHCGDQSITFPHSSGVTEEKGSFFGLFDGHNGTHCAQYLHENLLSNYLEQKSYPKDMSVAFTQSFQEVDSLFLEQARANDYEDGASALVVHIWNNVIYVANSGDSMGYLCCTDGAIPMTDILRAHGFGNLSFKDKKKVVVTPKITQFDITPQSKFFILGTWTFWNSMNPKEVIEYILEKLNNKSCIDGTEIHNICLELVSRASSKAEEDNISCLLVIFRHKSDIFQSSF